MQVPLCFEELKVCIFYTVVCYRVGLRLLDPKTNYFLTEGIKNFAFKFARGDNNNNFVTDYSL
jgi:hypothetical protein